MHCADSVGVQYHDAYQLVYELWTLPWARIILACIHTCTATNTYSMSERPAYVLPTAANGPANESNWPASGSTWPANGSTWPANGPNGAASGPANGTANEPPRRGRSRGISDDPHSAGHASYMYDRAVPADVTAWHEVAATATATATATSTYTYTYTATHTATYTATYTATRVAVYM
jgi:hypothetical protein